MPAIIVLNVFSTDTPDKQDRLISAMREIADTAKNQGWISSAIHSGLERPGAANLIRWRSKEDLEERYRSAAFRERTRPLFDELTTSMNLLQTTGEVEVAQPGEYVVIEIFGVRAEDRERLIAELPGAVLCGLDESFVVSYSRWADKESFEAHRGARRLIDELATWSEWNSYQVVHTRSA